MIWMVIILAALGHGFLWVGIVNRLHGWAGPRPVVDFLTRAFLLAFLAIPPAILWQRLATTPTLAAALDVSNDWTSYYIVFCAGVGVLSLCVKLVEERNRYDRQALTAWDSELIDVALAVGKPLQRSIFARALALFPANQVALLSTDRKQLTLPRLPPALEGLRIVHLSDLHMTGRIDRAFFDHLAEHVNALQADVIALTGDIIEKDDCRDWLTTSLGRMQARLGKYFILGNHDLYIDSQQTIQHLTDYQWHYVCGRWLEASWNNTPVLVGGNELPWNGPAAPLAEQPPDGAQGCFRVGLLHTPDQFDWSCRANVDLALGGHTHGGQVCPPLLGALASPSLFGTRYACGVFRRGSTIMHVTRGVSGKTPIRWRCPPEVAILELRRRSDGATEET